MLWMLKKKEKKTSAMTVPKITEKCKQPSNASTMESVWSAISGICRLCLCEGDEILVPACKILNSPSAVEDLERCTGIRIDEEQNVPYSICEDCGCKLNDFATFRTVCLTNDAIFRKWFPMVFGEDDEPERPEGSFTQPDESELEEKKYEITDHTGYTASLENNVLKIEYLEIANDYSDDSDGDHGSAFEGELEIDEELTKHNALECAVKNVLIKRELSVSLNENNESEQIENELLAQDTSNNLIQRAEHGNASNAEQYDGNKHPSNKMGRKRLCPICGKLVYGLKDHKLSHTNEKKYSCSHCSMAYGSKAYLKFHIQSVHQKKAVRTCDVCKLDFAYISSYDAHMRARHNVGKWYECIKCNIKFRHPGGLRNHNNRKHNDESNCECPVCGLKFLDKTGLRNHSRVHSSEKKFACKYCQKRFRSPNARRGHELTHLGITFECPHCPKSYRYQQNLKIHLSKHGAKENAYLRR